MSTNFPASLDVLSNPVSTDGLTGHASQHANENDAIEALQAKVGVDSSAVPTSLDYRVAALESGDAAKALLRLASQGSGLSPVEQGVLELIGNSLQFTNLAKRRAVVQSQSVITSGIDVTNTLTETSLIASNYGADYLEVGKSEEFVLRGIIGKANTNTLTLRLKYAGATVITLAVSGAAITTGTAFEVVATCTCRSTGATGTMQVNLLARVDGVTNPPDTRALVTINTTTTQSLELTAQWGTASTNNTMTIDHGRVLCIDGAK